MPCPRTGYGPGGGVEELVLAESATPSFLASIRAAGIAVPEGFQLIRTDRASEAVPSGQPQPSQVVGGGSQGSNYESVTVLSHGQTLTFSEFFSIIFILAIPPSPFFFHLLYI